MSLFYGRKKISYEWDVETIAENDDIVDHDHASVGCLKDLVEYYLDYFDRDDDDETVVALDLVLVQNFYTDEDGLIDRDWYYLDTDTFEFNPPLPTKLLQKEFEDSLPIIKKIKFKSVENSPEATGGMEELKKLLRF